jgi:hypothetical protein
MGATTGSVQDSQWGPEIIPFPERELDGWAETVHSQISINLCWKIEKPLDWSWCSLSYLRGRDRRIKVQGKARQKVNKTLSKGTSQLWWLTPVIPAIWEVEEGGSGLRQKAQDLIWKITKSKKFWECGSSGCTLM